MKDAVALYIHIPFCKQKCLYCDFPSFSGKDGCMLDYSKALSKEIDKLGDTKINTIFIGGGTPTYLSLEALEIIKCSIDKLNKCEDLEFTVEGNPGTFQRNKLKLFKAMGVNRLSIGLQAWKNETLKVLGRIHTIEDFKESFYMARNEGFQNINVDLMLGLPNQSYEEWMETLENVTAMNPEHISCYSLIIEEGTYFKKLFEEDKLEIPSEDIERKMYEECVNFLIKKGYYKYEISNFAKKGKECRHNLVYWNTEDYIGCGAGAHSYLKGIRYSNEQDIEKYIEMIDTSNSAMVESYENKLEDKIEEFMFMGLRKVEGISKKDFMNRFSKNIENIYGDIINKYKKIGLIIVNGDRIFLSEKGMELSNSVMCDFILDKKLR